MIDADDPFMIASWAAPSGTRPSPPIWCPRQARDNTAAPMEAARPETSHVWGRRTPDPTTTLATDERARLLRNLLGRETAARRRPFNPLTRGFGVGLTRIELVTSSLSERAHGFARCCPVFTRVTLYALTWAFRVGSYRFVTCRVDRSADLTRT